MIYIIFWPGGLLTFYFTYLFIYFLNFILFNFTILYWFCHISKWIHHRYTCVPHPEPSSLLPTHWHPTCSFSPRAMPKAFPGSSIVRKWKWSRSVVSDSLQPYGAYQALRSMGFSRQEYWSGLPFPYSRGSSQPRDQTQVSCIADRCFTIWATLLCQYFSTQVLHSHICIELSNNGIREQSTKANNHQE